MECSLHKIWNFHLIIYQKYIYFFQKCIKHKFLNQNHKKDLNLILWINWFSVKPCRIQVLQKFIHILVGIRAAKVGHTAVGVETVVIRWTLTNVPHVVNSLLGFIIPTHSCIKGITKWSKFPGVYLPNKGFAFWKLSHALIDKHDQ